MRKEYDFSNGERGKFYRKVDTKNPLIEADDETLDEIFEDELVVLESNLARIEKLKLRITELDETTLTRFDAGTAQKILDDAVIPEL